MHIPAPADVIRRDLRDAATHSPKTRRAERQAKRGRLSLALQGGGSFGAFTWGVLDRLLEEEDLPLDVVSGASAGAINAVVMATGLAKGGREEARARLARFWTRVMRDCGLTGLDEPFQRLLTQGMVLNDIWFRKPASGRT